MSNLLTKELAKMLRQTLKVTFPYATFKVTTHRGNTIDMINVNYDGEIEIGQLYAIAKSYQNDGLTVNVSGASYRLI